MPEKSPKFYIIISMTVFVIIVVFVSIFSVWDTAIMGKKEVSILVAPSDSVITIGNKVVNGDSINNFT